MDPKLLSGADLAFIGDAYYELCIRDYAIKKDITNLNRLHKKCVKFVSRDAQNYIINNLMNELSDEEKDIFKRGRNYNYKTKTAEYINASGFEAVIGYHYLLGNNERLAYLISKSISLIEEKNE